MFVYLESISKEIRDIDIRVILSNLLLSSYLYIQTISLVVLDISRSVHLEGIYGENHKLKSGTDYSCEENAQYTSHVSRNV